MHNICKVRVRTRTPPKKEKLDFSEQLSWILKNNKNDKTTIFTIYENTSLLSNIESTLNHNHSLLKTYYFLSYCL